MAQSEKMASFAKKAGLLLSIPVIAALCESLFDVDIFMTSYPTVRLFVVQPIIIPISVCFYAAVYVLIIKLVQGGIWLFTMVLWRIVEFPQGAWSAVVFIATAVLGIAYAVVKH